MKGLLGLYQNVGKAAQKSLNKTVPFLLDGPKPPTWQTPGRLQYYRAENEVYLPDEIKWQIRMPKTLAMRKNALPYNSKVQDEILAFIGSEIKHDYMQGNRDINLDLTVEEAQKLYAANGGIRDMAESGELQKVHQSCVDFAKAVDSGYIKVMDQLDRTGQQITEAEQDIYEDLLDSELDGLTRLDSKQGERSIFDRMSGVQGDAALENYEIVKRAAEAKGDSDVIAAEKSLKSLLTARARLFAAKADIQEAILERMTTDQGGAIKEELNEYRDAAGRYGYAAEGEAEASSADVYSTQLQSIFDGDMRQLMSDIDACASSQATRSAMYEQSGEVSADDANFRADLLKHLAGSIVIKEHRIRYQKEQFDRFITSLDYSPLKDNRKTLLEFSEDYSRLIDATTESSHNFRCPKIEANYDDFGEQTIRPLNATIFFYFFSANRSGKTWAQWMLSSVRYPNDRMRRAYMRFFA